MTNTATPINAEHTQAPDAAFGSFTFANDLTNKTKIRIMKSIIISSIAIVLLMALSLDSNAQNTRSDKKGERYEARDARPEAQEEKKPLQQVSVFSGQVVNWANNDDYVYDGFYLQTGNEKYLVKFPPHLGTQLTTAVKTGSTVSVNGAAAFPPQGEKEIRFVSITADGKTYYNTPPAEVLTFGSGKIYDLQKNKQGDVKGYILDDRTILRLPPHVAKQLNQVAVVGAGISYSGVKKILETGEVSVASYTIIHCQTVTINGIQYLTK
jgi:hypothetical protein